MRKIRRSIKLLSNMQLGTLHNVEVARAKAQTDLAVAERGITDALAKANKSFSSLQASFTPPSTPACQSEIVTLSMPSSFTALSTPTCRSEAVLSTPSCFPSPRKPLFSPATRIELAPAPPTAWYIVYHGVGGAQGLFDCWDGGNDAVGARDIADHWYAHRSVKKFDDFCTAKMYYNEVRNTGVNPGIYKKRYELLNKGLGWRGGYVIGATRGHNAAIHEFGLHVTEVERLDAQGPRSDFDYGLLDDDEVKEEDNVKLEDTDAGHFAA
ncbi:hypothetical protein BDP27DRAFT_1370320 [Rhodocollybia butyracea]|uniref:Uncharacterized protein n=1 Tax=Rhodocollybia butyracea TaxID=206335 RepID=A0A9P5PC56_9AGAR|nr:hypothetical protein BDP27DRAFT_1370320 [Rhodocollybia butyracea]